MGTKTDPERARWQFGSEVVSASHRGAAAWFPAVLRLLRQSGSYESSRRGAQERIRVGGMNPCPREGFSFGTLFPTFGPSKKLPASESVYSIAYRVVFRGQSPPLQNRNQAAGVHSPMESPAAGWPRVP